MEPREESGKWLFIAHAVCCGGPLLAILLLSNAAFLLSLVRSGFFWVGVALLLGGAGFYGIRRRRTCAVRPSPEEAYATDERSSLVLNPTDGKEHRQEGRSRSYVRGWVLGRTSTSGVGLRTSDKERTSVFPSVRGINPPTAAS